MGAGITGPPLSKDCDSHLEDNTENLRVCVDSPMAALKIVHRAIPFPGLWRVPPSWRGKNSPHLSNYATPGPEAPTGLGLLPHPQLFSIPFSVL